MNNFVGSVGTHLGRATHGLRYLLDEMTFDRNACEPTLQALSGSRRNQPMLVVGNGPSLLKTPLDEFHGVGAIGVNKIDLLYPKTTWRPHLVCCVNGSVAQQHADKIVEKNEAAFFSWKSRFMMDRATRQKANFFLEMPNRPFSTNISEYVAVAPTVTFTALQFAYWMGANPVILFGCDHSFKFNSAPLTYEKMVGDDPNHFDPNYFKGSHWGTPDFVLMEQCYAEARGAFEADGRKIYDATVDGKLQVFEKISLDEAREICRKGKEPET